MVLARNYHPMSYGPVDRKIIFRECYFETEPKVTKAYFSDECFDIHEDAEANEGLRILSTASTG